MAAPVQFMPQSVTKWPLAPVAGSPVTGIKYLQLPHRSPFDRFRSVSHGPLMTRFSPCFVPGQCNFRRH